MSTPKPNKAKNISLRLSDAQEHKIREMAEKFSVSQTKIIEWALSALADYYHLHNGRIALPIDLREIWTLANRTQPTHGVNEKSEGYRAKKKGTIDVRNAAAPLPTYLIQRTGYILEPKVSKTADEKQPS